MPSLPGVTPRGLAGAFELGRGFRALLSSTPFGQDHGSGRVSANERVQRYAPSDSASDRLTWWRKCLPRNKIELWPWGPKKHLRSYDGCKAAQDEFM
jgi:hypothetical protein